MLEKEHYDRLVRTTEADRRPLASLVRMVRVEAGLTQAELARRLGVSQAMIAGVESGRIKIADGFVSRVREACALPSPTDRSEGEDEI